MSSDIDDYPFHIPTRREPASPPSPAPPVMAPPAAQVPAIHIHLAAPTEAPPVTPRPWYFTGTGLLWLLVTLGVIGAASFLGWQWVLAQGWF